MVYLIHLERKIAHAGHYLGSSQNLERRLADHRKGRGARLLQVANQQGIHYGIVRLWEGGRIEERRLHRRKASPRLCPKCRGC